MSALLATRYSDRVEMAADGATFDQSGNLIARTDKLRRATNAPIVVGGCGRAEDIESLARLVVFASIGNSIDAAIKWLASALPDRREVSSAIPFELVIGCMSEKDGPQIWRFRSLRPSDVALPTLRLEWRETVALGPELTSEEILAAGYCRDDFLRTSNGMMQAMRSKRCKPELFGDVPLGHYVGCHVDHAVIAANGVTIDRVIEWPDEIGQPIRV